jgi:glycosyltransferase involved in cell wall biosynthesis
MPFESLKSCRGQTTAQVIVPTHNRAPLLLKTVESILKQRVKFDRIIVSDNSYPLERRQETSRILSKHLIDNSDTLRIASPPDILSAQHHGRHIQDEYLDGYDYTMLLHDDDRLEPEFLITMKGYLDTDPNLVAAAANAWVVDNHDKRAGTLTRKQSGFQYIHSPLDLLRRYLDVSATGPPPLDGYLYRTENLKRISFDSVRGGKYSDVAALAELASQGSILWHHKPLMSYLQHPGQDSQDVSTIDFRNLISYLRKTYPSLDLEGIIANYRFKHFRLKTKTLLSPTKVRTRKKLRRALCVHALRHLVARKSTYMLLFRRLCRL